LFTASRPRGLSGQSAGVWGVTVGEVDGCGLEAWDDPLHASNDTPENLAHAIIEFGDRGRGERERAGRRLAGYADERKQLA